MAALGIVDIMLLHTMSDFPLDNTMDALQKDACCEVKRYLGIATMWLGLQ